LCLSRFAGAQAPAGKLLLRLHAKPGQVVNMTCTTDTENSINTGKRATTVKTNMVENLNILITKVDARGNATMVTTILSIRATTWRNGKETIYDSNDPHASSDPASSAFASLVGVSIATVVDPMGKVLKIEGLDDMMDRAFDHLPTNTRVTREGLDKMKNDFKKIFSDAPMQRSPLEMHEFPVQPLAVGDSWVNRGNGVPGLVGAMKSTMTLLARRDGRDLIGTRIDASPEGSPKPITMGNLVMTNSTGVHGSGTTTLDEASGLTIGGDIDIDSISRVVVRRAGARRAVSDTQVATRASVHLDSGGVAQPGG
jgi:hypothetical protein